MGCRSGAALADQVATRIREWHREWGNDAPEPGSRVAVGGTRDQLPAADPRSVIDKVHSRLVVDWVPGAEPMLPATAGRIPLAHRPKAPGFPLSDRFTRLIALALQPAGAGHRDLVARAGEVLSPAHARALDTAVSAEAALHSRLL